MKLFWLLPLPLPTAVLCVISVRNTALPHALVLWRWNLPVIRWCHTSWPAPPLPPRMGTGYWGVSRSIRSGFLTPACWSYAAFSWGNTKKALYERAGLTHDTISITKTALQRILPPNWKKQLPAHPHSHYLSKWGSSNGVPTRLREWRSGLQNPVLATDTTLL